MPNVELDGEALIDWPTFHSACQLAFGFPSFYGKNGDAWIDCLSYLYDEDEMTSFHLAPGELLRITVRSSAVMRQNAPAVLTGLEEMVAFVNSRYSAAGEQPPLQLVLT